MAPMLRRIAAALLTLGLCACTELPPVPGTGGAGGGGVSGNGGVGGAGGRAGAGGTGGLDRCEVIVPAEYSHLEPRDVVQQQAAIGQVNGVCPGEPCEGDDPFDRWSIVTCGGEHRVVLSWDEASHNLNLFVFTPDDSESWSSQGTDSTEEVLSEELQAGQQYIIQVQAADTRGNEQPYDVVVTPAN